MYKFRKLGFTPKLIEAGSYFGGTWHWNRYPGARVDSEFPTYQLSMPECYKTWDFSERFPDHHELREYFKHVDKTLSLSKDCYFNTIVTECRYENDRWNLQLHNGGSASCKYLMLCTGSSYKKHYPDFKDMDEYRGQLVHSAIFPEGGLDLKGKSVALVGNGATGVQILQEIAKEECEVTAYIRTPNIALPMVQRRLTLAEQHSYKSFYDMVFESAKQTRSGFPVNTVSQGFWDVSEEERLKHWEDIWQRGGFAFLLSNYRDFLTDKKANKLLYEFWAEKTRQRIKSPVKRDIVCPIEQPHYFGTKRPCLEQDYYESLDRNNVTLIDLKKNPISHFTETGIVTEGLSGVRNYDIVILATGYDSLTGSLMDLNMYDKNGKKLQDKWDEGIYTYLGLMIDGMPNAFMVYSPQAPTSLSNGPPIIEIQVDWAADAVKKMRDEGIVYIDPVWEESNKWRQGIQDMNDMTLFPFTDSW